MLNRKLLIGTSGGDNVVINGNFESVEPPVIGSGTWTYPVDWRLRYFNTSSTKKSFYEKMVAPAKSRWVLNCDIDDGVYLDYTVPTGNYAILNVKWGCSGGYGLGTWGVYFNGTWYHRSGSRFEETTTVIPVAAGTGGSLTLWCSKSGGRGDSASSFIYRVWTE